ncbi:unnamed protein product [Gongylonema pulchrum]|uniref:DNA_ligase_aden domain-containing protein n=1 Tax=Gongylonema pulchrum TaxID=637853 RepID=A0A183D3T4_9BILA|nr:unnamed protein product [Gongylonema pulchrum]
MPEQQQTDGVGALEESVDSIPAKATDAVMHPAKIPIDETFRFEILIEKDDNFRLGHFRLYKAELLRAIDSASKLEEFREFFGSAKDMDNILRLYKDENKRREALNDLFWFGICYNRQAMDRLVSLASEVNKDLPVQIYQDIPPKALEWYYKMFTEDPLRMDKLTTLMYPAAVCEKLDDASYDHIVKAVMEIMERMGK